MKKVLVVHTSYKNFGGEDVAVTAEFKFLKKHYDVELLVFKNSAGNYFQLFFQFLTSNNKKSNEILQNKIQMFKPDIVYVHNTWFKSNLGIFNVLKKNNLLTLLKIHNFRFDCTRSFSFKQHLGGKEFCQGCGIKNSRYKLFNKYFQDSYLKSFFVILYGKKYFKIIKSSDIKVICLTEFQKKYLINLGINQKKLFVHRNFINVNSNELSQYNQKSNYIIYAGRISKEKGVNVIIQNFLNFKSGNLKLYLVGDGPELRNIRKKFGSEKSIVLIEPIENKKVIKMILGSRAVITATTMYEGQPTLLTEASLLGVPSIFPNNGGIKEFFPPNYKLSFENMNSENFLQKLNLLSNSMVLSEVGKENKAFISKLLNEKFYLENFNKIINHD